MFKRLKKGRVLIYIALAVVICAVTAVVCVTCFKGKTLDFNAAFYYVCYKSPPDNSSTASVSALVHSYGGAGYIAKVGDKNFVTVSCYYSEEDATAVCKQLNKKGLSCSVVKAQTYPKKLVGGGEKYAPKYEGNLNTLYAVSKTCYALANSVDKFEVDQTGAKSVLNEIKSTLKGLAAINGDNCFTQELDYLIAECDDISFGYVFSYDIRRLQIAVCDCIVNVNIY